MRNVLKKALCLCLALCLAVSCGACYSEDDTWAAKHGDDVMPIGAYIYYLSSAYTEAGNRVAATDKILEGEIGGQKSKDWMKDRALAYVGAYYFICDKFEELGLEMQTSDLTAIETGASTYWPYFKNRLEAMGVSEESFKKAYAEHNVRARLVMLAMYGEGGEKELSESEMLDYYKENYDSYEYMYVSKSKMDEDGNSVALTDQEKQDMLDSINEYADKINSGETTFSEAYTDYSYETQTTPQHETPGAAKKSEMHPNISGALPDMKDNEAKVLEVDMGIYLLQKLSLEDRFKEVMEDATQKEDLLVEMKGDEFNEYALEQGKALNGVEVNEKAIGRVKVDDVVTDKNQTGASVAPSSSGDGESSAAESSETE